jgi:hypothetical protein
LPIQLAPQPQGPGDQTAPNPVVSPFESATLWIDDEIIYYAFGY